MKVFWDTNLFIYLWEKKSFQSEMKKLMEWMDGGSHTLVTSSLTVGEILVQPLRYGRKDIYSQYLRALQQMVVIPFDFKGADYFAKFRASNPSLRPPDAIQLSCACVARCDLFLTNDHRLSKIHAEGISKIDSLTDWASGFEGTP